MPTTPAANSWGRDAEEGKMKNKFAPFDKKKKKEKLHPAVIARGRMSLLITINQGRR